MECHKKVVVVCGSWTNIYGWGDGYFSNEKARNWHEFWDNFKAFKREKGIVYWDCSTDNRDRTPYVFSIQGCIYMHPMNFTAYLILSDGNSYDGLISELNEICQTVAEKCGSEFHMSLEEVPLTHNMCIRDMYEEEDYFKKIS